MQQKHLVDVMIDYLNWRSRYVGVRPRTVAIEPAAQADLRWNSNSVAIEAFLDKVRRGDDLTPHISMMPHTRGYSPAARAPGAATEDRWSDKDFLLNTMNYHHFHLDAASGAAGHWNGVDGLIFAEVGRDEFKVIAIFGHAIFDPKSPERTRLWELHEKIAFRGVASGQVVTGPAIATSGHAMHVVYHAQRCGKWMKQLEPQLDDGAVTKGWFDTAGFAFPKKPMFEWMFMHLDFGLHEKTSRSAFWLQKGWN